MKQPLHVERKVFTQTLVMLAVTAGIDVETGLDNVNVLSNLGVPAWATGVLLVLLPTIGTALVGYKTSHTVRDDLEPVAGAAGSVQIDPTFTA